MDSATASPASVKPAVEPRLLGELTVVILRARNLQDKSKVGKQSPYAVVTYEGDRKRTAAKKKGGQHPEWDEEVRFRIYEDAEDIVRRPVRAPHSSDPPVAPDSLNGTPSRESSASSSGVGGKTGGSSLPPIPGEVRMPARKSMTVQIFADDAKEPKLVGEAVVDLSQVIKSGEHDDWFQLGYKGREAGEISLELTYFINGAPPIPKKIASSSVGGAHRHAVATPAGYGGPGVFSAPGLPGTSSSPLAAGAAAAAGHRRPYSSASMSSLRPYGVPIPATTPSMQQGGGALDAIGEHGALPAHYGSLSDRRGSMNSSVAAPPDFRPGSARPPSGLYSQASLASRLSHSTSIGSSSRANGSFTASPSLEDSLSAMSLQAGPSTDFSDPHGSAPHPHRHSVTGAMHPAAWPAPNAAYAGYADGPPRPVPPPHANSSPATSSVYPPAVSSSQYATPPPPPRPFSAAFPPSSSFPHLQQASVAGPSYSHVDSYAPPPSQPPPVEHRPVSADLPPHNAHVDQCANPPYQDQQPAAVWPQHYPSQYPDQMPPAAPPPQPASYPSLPTVPPHLRKSAAAPSSPSQAPHTPPRPMTPSTGHYPMPTSSFHRNDDSPVVQSAYRPMPLPTPAPTAYQNDHANLPPPAPLVPPRPHSAAGFQEARHDWSQTHHAQDAGQWQNGYDQGHAANGYQPPHPHQQQQQQHWQPTHTHSQSAGSAYLRSLPVSGPTFDARATSPAPPPPASYYDQSNYAPSWQPPPPPPGDLSYQPRPPSPLPPPRVS